MRLWSKMYGISLDPADAGSETRPTTSGGLPALFRCRPGLRPGAQNNRRTFQVSEQSWASFFKPWNGLAWNRKTVRRRLSGKSVAASFCGYLLILFVAGCATPVEKTEQRALRQVAESYRPYGAKPALPLLTTNAPLRDFLTYALLNHPDVEAAYFDWSAAVARITSAGAPPDPQLTFQMDIQSVVTSLMPGLLFNFPGPGKLRAQADVAAAESAGKYYTFETRVLAAAYAVKKAYYELYFLTEKIAVNRATLGVLGDVESIARQRNGVGQATLQDVLRAQMEQERLQTEIANLEDSRLPLAAQFKAALGLPADAPEP